MTDEVRFALGGHAGRLPHILKYPAYERPIAAYERPITAAKINLSQAALTYTMNYLCQEKDFAIMKSAAERILRINPFWALLLPGRSHPLTRGGAGPWER